MKVCLSKELQSALKNIVFATEKETGVALFGKFRVGNIRVLHLADSGPKATHQRFQDEGDSR